MLSLRPRGASCLALLLVAVIGCVTVQVPSFESQRPLAPSEPVASPGFDRLAVALTRLERAQTVEIQGGVRGPERFYREGDQLRSDDGRRAPRFEVLPALPAGLALGERVYTGTLVVLPHPISGLRVLNQVPLEEYVTGVVAAELAIWSALPAELEAQAVAARTYALKQLHARRATKEAFLWDDVTDQAYGGRPSRELPAHIRTRLAAAIAASRGLVLVAEHGLVDARFHAACGGRTADPMPVFAAYVLGARSTEVDCEPCAERVSVEAHRPASARNVRWSMTATQEELGRVARSLSVGTAIARIEPIASDSGGRWTRVRVTGNGTQREIDLRTLRAAFGYTRLKSGMIDKLWPPAGESITAGLHISGRGRGHGVGLCQVGARDYANRGWNAARILAHYYGGARLVDVAAVSPDAL